MVPTMADSLSIDLLLREHWDSVASCVPYALG
jgi:hypothetical protein